MNVPFTLYPAIEVASFYRKDSAFFRDFCDVVAYTMHINAYDRVCDDRLIMALDYICANFSQSVIQAEVACRVGLTSSSFAKLLKEQSYMTFTEILNEVRVAHAVMLICNTNDSLESIGYDCGFGTRRTFNREFRQFAGYTPVDFRALFRKFLRAGAIERPFMPQLEGEKRRLVLPVEKGGNRIAGNELNHYRTLSIAY